MKKHLTQAQKRNAGKTYITPIKTTGDCLRADYFTVAKYSRTGNLKKFYKVRYMFPDGVNHIIKRKAKKMDRCYIIRDREAGNYIDAFPTLEEAKKTLEAYETEDRKNGIYTPDFYEIVEDVENLSPLVWEWADAANAFITPGAGGGWVISSPYDDYTRMTAEELEEFCTTELKEIKKAGGLNA